MENQEQFSYLFFLLCFLLAQLMRTVNVSFALLSAVTSFGAVDEHYCNTAWADVKYLFAIHPVNSVSSATATPCSPATERKKCQAPKKRSRHEVLINNLVRR